MVSQQSSCRVIEKLVSIQLLTKMSVPVIGLVLIEVRRCIDWKKLLVQLILNKLFTLLFYGVFLGGGFELKLKRGFSWTLFYMRDTILMIKNVWELTGKHWCGLFKGPLILRWWENVMHVRDSPARMELPVRPSTSRTTPVNVQQDSTETSVRTKSTPASSIRVLMVLVKFWTMEGSGK